jgi:16S rRNA (guanine1207-N2)-methyltransferase
VEFDATDAVLDLAPGAALLTLASAKTARSTVALTRFIQEHDSLQSILTGELAVEVRSGHGPGAVDKAFDVVVIRTTASRRLTQRWITEGWLRLNHGGRLYLAGEIRSGIKPAIAHLTSICANTTTLAVKKRCRVALATRSADSPPPSVDTTDPFELCEYTVQNESVPVWATPGVLSWDRLDQGTSDLLDAMEVREGEDVIDLGCGTGVVGAVAAKSVGWPGIAMLDSDWLAVEAARRTVEHHGGDRNQVMWSDCCKAVNEREFDVAVTNPPRHQGKDTDLQTVNRFLFEAAAILKPEGRFYAVSSRGMKLIEPMETLFRNVKTLSLTPQYQVCMASRPRQGHPLSPLGSQP